jgi:hypothetical protein
LVARVNDRTVAEHPSELSRRASGYLRWYPSAWRARYGEEFVAHLEAELEERPLSVSRGLNIVLHGVTARFRLERGFRWFSSVAFAAVMVAALVVGVLASEVKYPTLPLTMHGAGGAGIPTRPTVVNDFNFRFTNHSNTRIRILRVTLIGYKDYPIPRIVRVEVDPHHQKYLLINPPLATPGLVPAIGRTVILGNDDSIIVSVKASLKGRLYGVAGLTLQYVRNGSTLTKTMPQKGDPDLLCVEPRPSESLNSPYCTRSFTTVYSLWSFEHPGTPHQTTAQSEAWVTTSAALSYVASIEHRTSGLNDVREWATRLFAHRGPWLIAHITATKGKAILSDVDHELLFHFALVNRRTSQRTVVCVQNGAYFSGGEVSSGIAACPKP